MPAIFLSLILLQLNFRILFKHSSSSPSMRIAKHFICIPYHLIYLAIVLCLFCFTQSISFSHSLPFRLYSHSICIVVMCLWIVDACTNFDVMCMPRSLVHFVSKQHFLYVELTHFLTTGSFSLQVLTQYTASTNSVGSFGTIAACMHMKYIWTYIYEYRHKYSTPFSISRHLLSILVFYIPRKIKITTAFSAYSTISRP